jgi:hypothetical protein
VTALIAALLARHALMAHAKKVFGSGATGFGLPEPVLAPGQQGTGSEYRTRGTRNPGCDEAVVLPRKLQATDYYRFFRVVFGLYLFAHFAYLVPWGTELFSNEGALRQAGDSPLTHLFPNVLAVCDPPAFVIAMLIAGAGLSLLLMAGTYDRIAAVFIWYIWACLHGRMPLITNPSLPYVGWLLLAHASLPRPSRHCTGWRMPGLIFTAAWVLLAVGYTYSGYTKLASASWIDGSALERVLENPLARPGFVQEALLSLPSGVLRLATWFALGLELGFAPLALFRQLRPWLWALMLVMHLALIGLIDFADLSLGMVMMHLFTFDPRWVENFHLEIGTAVTEDFARNTGSGPGRAGRGRR